MTAPPPGAGVAAEVFFRGRWVEEVEVDILLIGVFGEKESTEYGNVSLLMFPRFGVWTLDYPSTPSPGLRKWRFELRASDRQLFFRRRG